MRPRWQTRLDLDPQSASEMTQPEVPWQFQATVKRSRSGQRPKSWKSPPLSPNNWNNPPTHSIQPLSRVRLSETPRTAACQASLSITNCWSLLRLMSIESVLPSNHLILCRPLLSPSTFPSIRVFSNESVLWIRWPKYWDFSFSISPSNE